MKNIRSAVNRIIVYGALTTLAIISITPLLWAFSASFTPNELIFKNTYPLSLRAFVPQDFTIEAYTSIFESGFGKAAINSLILAVSGVIFGGSISALAGFAFGRFEFPGKNIIFAFVLLTFMVPADVITIPTYILVNRLGWVNTWSGLIVPSLAQGMTIFLFTQFFKGFPQELLDAARVDGASWLRVFFSIILPNSKPVILTASLLLFIGQWSSFFWPLLVAPKPDMRVIQVAIAMAEQEYQTLWNELLAGALIAAIVPITLIMPFQRYYIEGVSGTGLKG
jgi:multiple sugar transport system permease protein/putative chitobiose transport system permease protein